MTNYEAVCDDCPLRTKVDLDRVGIMHSMGTEGVSEELHDGNKRCTVDLLRRRSNYIDSGIERSAVQSVNDAIEKCEGPHVGMLRSRCAVGLASTWRWSETQRTFTPNVSSPDEILQLLSKASYLDAMPYSRESYAYVGDLYDYSELDCGIHSPFHNRGIAKLTQRIKGTHATLPKGKAVMLDDAYMYGDVFRIRIAQGGPEYFFTPTVEASSDNLSNILAEGIFGFINADNQALNASYEIAAKIYTRQRADELSLDKFFREGGFRNLFLKTQIEENDQN